MKKTAPQRMIAQRRPDWPFPSGDRASPGASLPDSAAALEDAWQRLNMAASSFSVVWFDGSEVRRENVEPWVRQ